MQYWLMKTEPRTYSWQDLKKEKQCVTSWEGVRNYQARNFMRDEMKLGDQVFIYHSVVAPMAIMGIAQIVKEACPDYFAFEKGHKYFDAKNSPENPRWVMVDVQAIAEFAKPITLEELKKISTLQDMLLLQKGSRLSIQPVTKNEWEVICNLREIVKLA